jgi:hypothetical protein
MDIMTIKILVLAVVALLILATLAGELRPRRRAPQPGRMVMVREEAGR